ncbi:hypothetical protein P154DRAFT_420128 [Amniculicola lignicola CBS 123094]|uniref:Uncharacterized protein n=1 Tax=Amniculicola lignicola CBS 123094 TaxID=1392246 RepID=A0A6A5X325_9PLEO|nr:hypothetical protein P154DRAFT_420128 [Amniculicola lignicola CBS 123094]
MAADRTNTGNGRPLKPTLATNRTARTPVTPRLAPSAASTNGSYTGRSARSNADTTPRLATAAQDDLSTPVKAFLSSNITPRSSSRKSRVGLPSAQSTPSGTPTGPRPHTSNFYNGAPSDGAAVRDPSPMFFHASDVRPQDKAPAPPPKKAPAFFYANGQQDESRKAQVPSPPLSSVGSSLPDSKFFHVDSVSEARSGSPTHNPPIASPSPEPTSLANAMQKAPSLRPHSPSKDNWPPSYRKAPSQPIRPGSQNRPSALSINSGGGIASASHSPTTSPAQDSLRRRSSLTSAVRFGHSKSASLSSIDSASSLKKVTSGELPYIVPSPLQNENRVPSSGSKLESGVCTPNHPMDYISAMPSPSIQSPTKEGSSQSALERMNELAANARRERKVLDLEISNSSLLAINRTLEKEMRKQKAEIRRLRRMSRVGRMSTDTAVTSDFEGFSAIGIDHIADLSDMSELEEEPIPEEDPASSSESSVDEGAMSPDALAERDESHRMKDEKRLQIDLSKHHELLLDSQKMNQSLKKCTARVEELIKEGTKALAYQVRPSDVRLGGRVLSSEEHIVADARESRALLSPWTPSHQIISDPMDRVSLAGSDRTDRDSGVDLDGLNLAAPDADPYADISPLNSPLSGKILKEPHTPGMGETY